LEIKRAQSSRRREENGGLMSLEKYDENSGKLEMHTDVKFHSIGKGKLYA
jgi:hypothetical protein